MMNSNNDSESSNEKAEKSFQEHQGSKITIRGAGNEDQPASLSHDQLGFQPYVQAVYSFLLHPSTKPPFTLSVEGDWGTGKSSFLLQLEETLKSNKSKTVKFNAWRHDKVESMWAAFALHFIKELTDKLKWRDRIKANIKLNWHRFDWGKGWFQVFKTCLLFVFYSWIAFKIITNIPDASNNDLYVKNELNISLILSWLGQAGIVVATLFFLSKVAYVVGNPFQTDLQKFIIRPNYEGNAAFIEEFHHDFGKTIDVLAKGEEKIFVFIDDLDRAEVPKAAELMQGLNMMISNSPKLIFIIGMDREKVAAGVAAKYKDLLPFLISDHQELNTEAGLQQARAFGYNFLEKFIQLSFQIPQASELFTRDFIRSLSGTTGSPATIEDPTIEYNPVFTVEDGEDTIQFQETILLLAPFFENNPRKIKQLINIFRLKAHIANSTGLFLHLEDSEHQPLTIPQLGKFIALTIKWPQLLDSLAISPNFFREMYRTDEFSSTNNWRKNIEFMKLLNLMPKSSNGSLDKNRSQDYDMKNINIRPLLETSPSFNPGVSITNNIDKPRPTEDLFENSFEQNEESFSNGKKKK